MAVEKHVLVPIADGTEEIEAVCIIDVLRRAEAVVTVASVEKDLMITASRGTRIVADLMIQDCEDIEFDIIALPGGIPGVERLRDSDILTVLLKQQHEACRLIGAICAAPSVVLAHHGLLDGVQATGHPGFIDKLKHQDRVNERVVTDGRFVTSRGAGTAIEFALKLAEMLFGKQTADAVAASIVAS